MKKALVLIAALAMAPALTNCAYHGSGTNLEQVAKTAGMINVTTGDGTFENYKATGYFKGTEFGIAVGVPGLFKFMEIFPMQTNEELLGRIAESAKEGGANAMINVCPVEESYWGFPFGFIGIYVDRAHGTGIKTGK